MWKLTLALALLAGGALAQPQPRMMGRGEACNYTVYPPMMCREGLECRMAPQPPGSPPIAGAGGTCQPRARVEGETCNMTVFPALACAEGLRCVVPPTPPGQPPVAGAGGVCRAG